MKQRKSRNNFDKNDGGHVSQHQFCGKPHLKVVCLDKKNPLRPNSPGPLTDDWKVTDDSSVNFHGVFFFIFCYNLAKNEEKHIMEIYG